MSGRHSGKIDDFDRLKRILHSSSEHPSYEDIAEAITLVDKMEALAGRNCRRLTQSINAKL
jgi:hypothetical protein